MTCEHYKLDAEVNPGWACRYTGKCDYKSGIKCVKLGNVEGPLESLTNEEIQTMVNFEKISSTPEF